MGARKQDHITPILFAVKFHSDFKFLILFFFILFYFFLMVPKTYYKTSDDQSFQSVTPCCGVLHQFFLCLIDSALLKNSWRHFFLAFCIIHIAQIFYTTFIGKHFVKVL